MNDAAKWYEVGVEMAKVLASPSSGILNQESVQKQQALRFISSIQRDALLEAAKIAESKQPLYPREESTVCLVIYDAILARAKEVEDK